MPLPQRKSHHLAHGRVSTPGATYFITLVTQNRSQDLTAAQLPRHLTEALRQLHRDKILILLCATTMPDHFHMLFELGNINDLSLTISKFKNRTRKQLANQNLYWQRNYYDHRIRRDSNTNTFAQYIFLNPYRKNLIATNQRWPHWICSKNYHPEFTEQLNPDGTPPIAWHKTAPTAQQLIQTDQ